MIMSSKPICRHPLDFAVTITLRALCEKQENLDNQMY